MRVTVETNGEAALDVSAGAEDVLVPLDPDERAATRRALLNAIATLDEAGKPPANDDSGPCVVA